MADPNTYSVEAQHQRNISPSVLTISGTNLDLSHAMTSWGRWPLSVLLGTCRIFWSCNMSIAPWTRRQRSFDATLCLIALLAQIDCLLSYAGWHTHTHTHTGGSILRAISFYVCLVSLVLSRFISFITLQCLFNFIPPPPSLLALASGKFTELCHRATMFWLVNKL
jgi:hypothetical protein